MKNREIAELFYEIADILEYQQVEWKPRAYRKAAQMIENLGEDIENIYAREGKTGLTKIPGVGESIADHIAEYLETGRVEKFEKLKGKAPSGTAELMEIRGLGAKKMKKLADALGIRTLSDLKNAIAAHRLRRLDGFGEKSEKNLAKAIEQYEKSHARIALGKALPLAEEVISALKSQCKNTTSKVDLSKIIYTGSLRRLKETIGDIDILAEAEKAEALKVMDCFVSLQDVDQVILKGNTKSSVILREGTAIDLRVVPPESYGAALQYFTGSKEHNIELRNTAIKNGYKLSEYGLYLKESGKQIAGRSEEEIYEKLGLAYIPPELRENRGEIKAAAKNALPKLVEAGDIKGDFHIHTSYSEGKNSLKTMIEKAEALGYEYIAITDHSRSQKVANGLEIEKLKAQWEEIDKLSKRFRIKILKGSEVDILRDGSLDYPDEILKELDIVVGGVHSGFALPERKMTERIVTALENKYLDILAHPSGRLFGKREPYSASFEKVFEVAATNGKVLEINSQPSRLDLNDEFILRAKTFGLKFCISTDSHSTTGLGLMRYGLGQARRGWLEKEDVVNTYPYSRLNEIFKKHNR
ncbi:MAG: DNA polymerase/3'-5' exonuclease PolX [Methanosarcina sp.]|nr:DNA polymerase/3'-5' exonuclease PolX [Methanosarcina sp.]MDD3872979.1 DNA polymerase/3'-5' exonuclease PolX [Methanosarcina sp.]MDD4522211.1 DNA polymerase/3'-5' exonuclease PolX [Methanosarcina sp.]HHV24090.1 DNA polymerase/3'-5' exonuclease PolX [Methanosarcina sp.]